MRSIDIRGQKALRTVLCLGAHSDDIEIGCGATIRKLVQGGAGMTVHWVVFTAKGVREQEARASAKELLSGVEHATIIVKQYRNGFFPYIGGELKEFFETLKDLDNPDLILTHYRRDLHQDHRLIAELTLNTFRDHLILEYEVPKYDGDLGTPNVFVPFTAEELDGKVAHLETHFKSQHDKQWFTRATFEGLSRLRGIECNSPTGLAEAFYGRKLVIA